MKKRVLLPWIIGFLLFSLNTKGQVISGLKGDRFMVNVSPQFSMTYKEGFGPKSGNFGVEYVIKNYKSIVIRGGFSSFSSGFDWISNYDFYNNPLYGAKGEFVSSKFSEALLLKSFRRARGDLAPLGQYWIWGIKVSQNKIDISQMFLDGKKGDYYGRNGGVFNYVSMVPVIGFGKSSKIAPKLLLNWEVNSELDLLSGFYKEIGVLHGYEDFFINSARKNNFYWNILQFKLGLSYAIF